ncbi:hypothetical protein TNCV_3960471 [Trichonephila clavipes]|nr:hypothetical protein TNCV_3960471 [Trichonephila clavipes]
MFWNSGTAGSSTIENAIYHSVLLLLTLVGIQRLTCEYGIDRFKRVILSTDLDLSGLNSREHRHVVWSAFKDRTAISWTSYPSGIVVSDAECCRACRRAWMFVNV